MIHSLLDNDLYKFTMQQAVVELYPEVRATYRFINRCPADRFNGPMFDALTAAVEKMSGLQLQPEEYAFLGRRCGYFRPAYLEYLRNYRFHPDEVEMRLEDQGELSVAISGPWHRTILWEVPLLATISELHGRHVDTAWSDEGQVERIRQKSATLRRAGCPFADFGTRRRRNYPAQRRAVEGFRDHPGFLGTSNVHFTQRYDLTPIGTMAHEWIMAHSVLSGLRHANRFALEAWAKVYGGRLGIALTDTYGSEAFFGDFDAYFARLYDGVRQDSGCPFDFTEHAIGHYRHLGIDPAAKTIVFSDGLTADSAAELKRHCGDRIRCAFGIGTNLTNDFPPSKALDIVIKLAAIDGVPVVKLTDHPAKATGDRDALRVARWTFFEMALEEDRNHR